MIFEEELNETVRRLKPSGIRKFFDIASSRKGVISLGVGEPDFITPWHIREAAIYAIEKGRTFYTANKGLLELRKGICEYYFRRFKIRCNPEKNCLVTVGGSEAIDLVLRTIIKPGDEVILPTPAYVAYASIIELCGGIVKEVEMKEENHFKLTKEALLSAITPRSKAVILNFPSNPTGGIMSHEDYEKIVPVIKEHNLYAVTDEIYGELTYEGKHSTIGEFAEIKDHVIIINGFSKAYSMTGYRIGYILADEKIINLINKVHQYTIMCASTISQFAAIEAVNNGDEDIERMYESFKQRRNYLVKELNRIGLKTFMPEGAFYVFPSIKCTGLSSEEFCERLLDEENLALVPGNAFGKAGEGYVRISYAYSLEELKTATGRIENFLKKLNVR